MGAVNVNAATNPSAPAASAFTSRSILTNAPSRYRFEAVSLGASVSLAKLLHLRLM
jgi:hypothetical protein